MTGRRYLESFGFDDDAFVTIVDIVYCILCILGRVVSSAHDHTQKVCVAADDFLTSGDRLSAEYCTSAVFWGDKAAYTAPHAAKRGI